MNIIFLDFDGVINCDGWLEQASSTPPYTPEEELLIVKMKEAGEHPADYAVGSARSICPDMVAHVNSIIEASGAKVVISSAWRKLFTIECLRLLLEHNGFKGEIIGVTPAKRQTNFWDVEIRAVEIKAWLESSEAEQVTGFVILDDDPSPGYEEYYSNNTVTTSFWFGMTEEHTQKAIDILNPVIAVCVDDYFVNNCMKI
jgi:hypothetical protein